MATAAPASSSPELARSARPGEVQPASATAGMSIPAATRTNSSLNGRDTPPVPGAFITPPTPAYVLDRPRSARASTFTSTSGSWHTAIPDDLPEPRAAGAPATVAPAQQDNAVQGEDRPGLPWISRMLAVFGRGRAGSRRRRALVSLITASVEGSAQIVTIIVLLAFSSHKKSPTQPIHSEWDACERPLGVWNVIWLLRTILMCLLAVWHWQIVKHVPDSANGQNANDAENGQAAPQPVTPGVPPAIRSNRNSPAASASGIVPPAPPVNGRNRRLAKPPLYTRLSLLCSLLSLTWFITAHFLVYTSLNTCRHSAPHLWWLTFAILCITYFAIIEAFLIGLVVLIIFPLLFLFLNIILLCLGRHPIQNPLGQIKPTIGKLPKATVDKLPLVMYIPAPPEDEKGENGEAKPGDSVAAPQPVHLYPPKPAKPASSGKKRFRFAFLRRKPGTLGADGSTKGTSAAASDAAPRTWEENWVPNGFPFVRLEGNRAACAICLMDFEEPPRARGSKLPPAQPAEPPVAPPPLPPTPGGTQQVRVEDGVTEEQLRLADAGEEAQPLRLLPCGHVFHRTCLDPWLTEVSGRCPTCQRAIEVPDVGGKRRRRRRGNRDEAQP